MPNGAIVYCVEHYNFFVCVVRVQTSINSLISLEVVLVKLNMMLFLEADNII
jgi:hypothetical protein